MKKDGKTEVHTQTATASHCSCGKLWIDHCEILAIRNEKLTAMLKRLVEQSYEHERGHHGQTLCACSSIRLDARNLLKEGAAQ